MILQFLDKCFSLFPFIFFSQYDGSFHYLTADFIRYACDGTFYYSWVCHQSTFHFEGADTVTGTLDHISCTDREGKTINWNSVKGKYVLLDFWASWNKESIATQDSLVPVQKALKKNKFVIISLSLDLDKKEWMEKIIQRDTTQWKQVCDFKGWDNSIVKQQGITRIPANILIGPDKRVITQDIRGKELIDKVKQLIEQDKEKEKAAKEAERTRKRQNKK